jgi:uncharacterized protein YjbJ (UPF0337 family)
MTDKLDPMKSSMGRQGEADSIAGQAKEAAGKATEKTGKKEGDRQLEAEGKFEKHTGHAQDKLGRAERKLEDEG